MKTRLSISIALAGLLVTGGALAQPKAAGGSPAKPAPPPGAAAPKSPDPATAAAPKSPDPAAAKAGATTPAGAQPTSPAPAGAQPTSPAPAGAQPTSPAPAGAQPTSPAPSGTQPVSPDAAGTPPTSPDATATPPPATPEPAPAPASTGASATLGTDTTGADTTTEPEDESKKSDRGAIVAGGKFGGLATFTGLGANITGAVEVGYIFPWLKRSFGLVVDVSYAAPVTSGTESDPRVAGGTYDYSLVQKELTIAPIVMYRYTGIGKLVPYIGVGPRIVLLEGVTDGMVGGTPIPETKEQSTEVGVGVPLGAEYLIGPGAALGELLFAYNKIEHQSTGNSSLTSLTFWLGYRFML